MVNLLVAAALAAASPIGVPPSAPVAEPAMFVVRDADTTVYIFGTFHALDGRSEWFGNEVRDAFEHSGELVLETLIPEQPQPGPYIPAIRAPSVTPSASFLATTRMAINAGRAQGMQVGNGADMVLRRVAEAEGKPVEGLETLQLQIDMFNRMPANATTPASRAGQPVGGSSMAGLSRAMGEMQSAWKRGDQSVFVRMLDQLRQASPDTYRMMFTERNDRWADWIRARMQAPGTVFVAVGAGHLAGPDSLLVRLAERGIPSQRIK
ncbi:TraB/GumN family protein [Sphingomonas sp.]|uniref:TraB/GumN family protein n=1 Tax=Sphingomonas sp. TaxID=28214 RepID=UPI0038A8B5A9